MSDVTFLFTNPRHHLAMMAPVAQVLQTRGIGCQLASLAELRGFRTPRDAEPRVSRLIPVPLRRSPAVGAAFAQNTQRSPLRSLVTRAVGRGLADLTRIAARGSRVLVIPNDVAFPYDAIIARSDKRVVLLQEGIRFPMPTRDAYGTGPIAAICAWGEGSREYFQGRRATASITVTGSPRHDRLDIEQWRRDGEAFGREHGAPLLVITNPIEHQGFGTHADRLAMFEQLVVELLPVLRERQRKAVVKNHAFEDASEYEAILQRVGAGRDIVVDRTLPLFAALAVASAAVVFTSTAGLEAMLFDVPIAALELPTSGFGFEYVAQDAAVGLRRGAIAAGIAALFGEDRARERARFVERHLYDRGRAAVHVADALERLL